MGTGLESMRNGAQDFLTKGDIDAQALERSIRYAIQRNEYRAHLSAAAVSMLMLAPIGLRNWELVAGRPS